MMSKTTVGQFLVALIVFWVAFGSIAYGGDYEQRLRALEEKYESKVATLSILERFSWKGDFRFRGQIDERDQAEGNTLDRSRLRVRFRLSSKVHMYKDLDIGFRVVTGSSGSQTSANATLDNTFSNKNINLDRAYFKWNPKPFVLQGGKFQTPFMKSELIWDSDVNVEGASEQFSYKTGGTQLNFIFGQFILEENNPGDDIMLYAYQGIVGQQTDSGKFDFALAYYDYADHEDPATAPTGAVSNNTLSEVKVLNLMSAWSHGVYGKPLKVFAEYAKNTGALAPGQPDLDTAWQVGFAYGKSGQQFGDWGMHLIYRLVQTESVLDALADSDFNGGLSNSRGIEAMGTFGLRKGVKLVLSYFNTQEERGPRDERETVELDLNFNF